MTAVCATAHMELVKRLGADRVVLGPWNQNLILPLVTPLLPGRNRAGLAIFRYGTRCGVVPGHTGNFPGYTQLIAATPGGRKSITFSLTTQGNKTARPALLEKLRAIEEAAVRALLHRQRG
jgi:D-alanyl-D-alanine carboxypeptidase